MKVLITGGTGFVGRRWITETLQETDWEIVSLERLSWRQTPPEARKTLTLHDFRAPLPASVIQELADVDYVVHCGAEVCDALSAEKTELFVQQNLIGTFNLLEAARQMPNLKAFQYISSADTLGPATADIPHKENATLNPATLYAAAKGGGELLSRSYHQTFKVPTHVVRPRNIYGEGQGPEKFLPTVVRSILKGDEISVHVGKKNESGSRCWVYVSELVRLSRFLLEHGQAGESYHAVGDQKTNEDIVFGASRVLDRVARIRRTAPAGNQELHYTVQDTKLANLGWKTDLKFSYYFGKTVQWLEENQ